MKITRIISPILTAALLITLAACQLFHPKLPPSTAENLPPETHISFFFDPDTTLGPGDFWVNNGDTVWVSDNDSLIMGLDTTVSVQTVHWWGDDPDGDVIGYEYRWAYMDNWVFTQDEKDTFYLPLRTQFDIYSLQVRAMDNDSLVDPTPAITSFPVYNSPPSVDWKLNSLPVTTQASDDEHISFTHHSFFWDVSDIDGQETITEVYYALDDTTDWILLEGDTRDIMLTDIEPGYHRIFLKVRDIAGAYSNIISFPDPESDDTYIDKWLVKEPVGDILIVNDYQNDQLDYVHQNFYKSIFDDIVGSDNYSVWEIGGNRTNSANTIPYSPEDIEMNLSTFSKVFWYTFRGDNSVNESNLALTRFVADGGTLFMNNAQKYATNSRPDTIWTFTHIDSVYSYTDNGWVFVDTKINALWGDDEKDSTLELSVSSFFADRLFAVIPGSSSTLRYQFEHTDNNLCDYEGTPPVMIETPIGAGKTYYMSLPLFYLNGNDNLDALFNHIFELDE